MSKIEEPRFQMKKVENLKKDYSDSQKIRGVLAQTTLSLEGPRDRLLALQYITRDECVVVPKL
jgi:hypothetical protein